MQKVISGSSAHVSWVPNSWPAKERSGVITGYHALVNAAAVGMGFEALVQITLERGDASTVASFEVAVVQPPRSATRNASSATPTTCCGPGGEGQARGQARSARSEPLPPGTHAGPD